MLTRLIFALLVMLVSSPTHATGGVVTRWDNIQSYAAGPGSGYCSTTAIAREWWGFTYNSPACSVLPAEVDWPKARVMWFSAEGYIPSNAVKNSAVTTGGSSLDFLRFVGPPDHDANCLSGVDLYDEDNQTDKASSGCYLNMSGYNGTCSGGSGTSNGLTPQNRNAYPCNTNADCVSGTCSSTVQCYSGANAGLYCKSDADCPGGYCPTDVCRDWGHQTGPLRASLSGDTLKGEVSTMAASISAAKPGAQLPTFILSLRYELITPPELQLSGFDPNWLSHPQAPTHPSANGDAWLDFYTWLTNDDASSVCATTNADCVSSGVGKNKVPNGNCIDAPGGANGWQNGLKGKCRFTYTYSGSSRSFYHDTKNKAVCEAGGGTCNGGAVLCTGGTQNGTACGAWTGGGWDKKDSGLGYESLLTLLGRSPTDVIYYLTRPSGSNWAPQGVVVNMNAPGYAEWRAALSKRMVDEIHSGTPDAVVMVQLNHKMSQVWNSNKTYSWYVRDLIDKYDGAAKKCAGGASVGLYCTSDSACPSSTCPAAITAAVCVSGGGTCTNSEVCVGGTSGGTSCKDGVVQVSEVIANGDGGYSGNQDPADSQADWAMGWWKVARALHAAGVKYSPWIGNGPFFMGSSRGYCKNVPVYDASWNTQGTMGAACGPGNVGTMMDYYDDPRTPTINEQKLIKETIYNADLIMTSDTPGQYCNVSGGEVCDAAGTGCVGGETGADLIECSTNCKGKRGGYLLKCVADARNTPLTYVSTSIANVPCPTGHN